MEAFYLCAVTRLGARSVSFNEIDGFRAVSSLLIGAPQRAGLTGGKRRVDRGPLAVGPAANAANDGMDLVAVALGIVKAAQGEHADAFAKHGAVRIVRERTAIAGRRQGGRFRKAHEHQDVVQRVDTACEHHVGIARAKFVHRNLQGRKARGTGRVGHVVAAAQIEAIGDPSGDDIAEKAREGAFLPLGIMVLDPSRDGLDVGLSQTILPQAVYPGGALQPPGHMRRQLGGGSDA